MDDVPLRDVPLDCEVTVALRGGRLALNLKRLFAGTRRLEIVGSIHNDISPCTE